jgi:hypothetical protein
MSIIQISKIQQRSGDLVDLPQLDEAEFGFASDQKLLFIGKTLGATENVEVLTAYSEISFSQLDGAIGNLDIEANVANGQVLVFNNGYWVNAGGNASAPANSSYWTSTPIHLGNIDNLYIGGGAIGYVLTTDGSGALNWTPKGTVVQNINTISANSTARLTLQNAYPFDQGAEITINMISNSSGTYSTNLNGDNFFLKPVAGNIQLYDLYQDSALLIPVNSSTYGTYPTDTGIVIFNTVSANGGEPGGSNLSVQYNSGADFAGDAVFLYDYTNKNLTLGNATTVANIYANSGTIGANIVTANLFTGTLTTSAQPNITSTGNLTVPNLTVTGTSNLGSNANVYIGGGNPTQVLTTDGLGNLYWSNGGGGGTEAVGYYLFTQNSANTTWVINHNLNTQYVSVNPVFANSTAVTGHYDYPNVYYNNANTVTLTFNSAITGYVSIVGDSGNSEGYYLHNQGAASTTWTVNHNLNSEFVAVAPASTADLSWYGRYDGPTISYTNANSLTLTFSSAEAGNVAIIGSSNIAGYYTHTQSVANTTWVVNHNLASRYLSVTPVYPNNVSMVGTYDFPNITYNNANALTLTFNSALTGNVVVVGGGGEALPAGGGDTEVQFNNGGALDGDASFTYNSLTNILSVPVITLSVVAFANLPSATTAGQKAFISDGNLIAAGNFGAIVSGSGSNTVPVYSDGTNWRIG